MLTTNYFQNVIIFLLTRGFFLHSRARYLKARIFCNMNLIVIGTCAYQCTVFNIKHLHNNVALFTWTRLDLSWSSLMVSRLHGLFPAGVHTVIRTTALRRTSVCWAPPFFINSLLLQSKRKHLPAPQPPPPLARHTCSRSTAHAAIAAAAASYPAHTDVRASNLSSIKAMQREFMLACHGNERRSGESFEQVDR